MKAKVTRKSMRNENIITVGYCSMQHVLNVLEPFAYSSGLNGWDCDYYRFGDWVISTGYRPIKGVEVDYETSKKYDDDIYAQDFNFNYEAKREYALELINKFIVEVTQ